jgi:hypothetical protein
MTVIMPDSAKRIQLVVTMGTTASRSAALKNIPEKDTQDKVKPESGINFVLYNQTLMR